MDLNMNMGSWCRGKTIDLEVSPSVFWTQLCHMTMNVPVWLECRVNLE